MKDQVSTLEKDANLVKNLTEKLQGDITLFNKKAGLLKKNTAISDIHKSTYKNLQDTLQKQSSTLSQQMMTLNKLDSALTKAFNQKDCCMASIKNQLETIKPVYTGTFLPGTKIGSDNSHQCNVFKTIVKKADVYGAY